MRTSELKGLALKWAVAKCEGKQIYLSHTKRCWLTLDYTNPNPRTGTVWSPSSNWAQGGPIIEREKIGFWAYTLDEEGNENPGWYAETFEGYVANGKTPLIAAMRCYVASKLGDEIELPEGVK